jgi:alpha/beta superfamily hydrolase
MLGALQGDAALMNAAMAASEIQPSLITASSTAAHAVSSSRLAFEASASVFAVGGYDDVVGVESTVQWMRGEDAPLAIVSPFQAVFAPPAGAAERLHLAP